MKTQLVPFMTIASREIRRFLRIWIQTLIPPAVMMVLYFVIFGNLIGSRLGQMGGVDYMQYIVPGLVMMSVITNSYANVASSFFSSKFQRAIEEMLVSPISTTTIFLGYVCGGMARGILVGLLVTILALFFTRLPLAHPGVTLLILCLTASLFSLGGFINGLLAQKFDDISIVPTFVLTPLTYLGGVFYSIALLPEFWQWVSKANPVVYMVNAFRYGLLGISDVNISVAISVVIAFNVALFCCALWLLNTGKGMKA